MPLAAPPRLPHFALLLSPLSPLSPQIWRTARPQVSPHPQCRLRVTVLKETSSGEHMFSVSGVVVSSVDARMERGKIGQWEYDKGKT